MTLVISGMLATGYAVAALFFLKFWSRTRDRLFGFFAAAFGLLAVQRVALSAYEGVPEDAPLLYGLRLVAFLVMLWAIVDKNRARG